MPIITFDSSSKRSFHQDLQKRVNAYFKENGISKHANSTMVIKTISLLLLYFIPYFLILSGQFSAWVMWIYCALMGFALAGIGMGIMHDACHGSYSSKKWVNKLLSYSMNLIGGNKYNWVIQHNVKHHTYTNIYHGDEDLENGDVIRLSPHSPYKSFHKLQHFYSWLLYGLGTLSWVTIKDFKQFSQYLKAEKDKEKRRVIKKELAFMVFTKILYYVYMVLIPAILLSIAWWQILIGFLTIHFIAGWVLSITFQLAHVVSNTEHTAGDKVEPVKIKDSWAIHQVKTTSNFARKNRFLNWYLGGLNFQIEHHLFPNICHIHYNKLSEIVKKVVEDHDMVYNEYQTMSGAIKSHYLTLKEYSMSPYGRLSTSGSI